MTVAPQRSMAARRAIKTLLHEAIDYAGLFPPAGLAMGPAVDNYATYLASQDRWALGRFVVPAARLEELAQAAASEWARDGAPRWRISALLADPAADMGLVRAFNDAHPGAVVDTVEAKAHTVEALDHLASVLPAWLAAFAEIPVAEDPEPLVDAIVAAGLRAKIRTGGMTPEAFPTPAQVARFIACCVRHRLPFKATAGLHHPLRGEFRLTYAADAPRAPMFGFLNVLLATALLREGGSLQDAEALLEEGSAAELHVEARTITWRGNRLDLDALAALRTQLPGFGSCSFREPLDDLTSLGFL